MTVKSKNRGDRVKDCEERQNGIWMCNKSREVAGEGEEAGEPEENGVMV